MSNVETLRRQYLIISFLQSNARYTKQAVSCEQIYSFLCEKDLPVSRRMVQRDMIILQKAVNAVKRRHGHPAGWTFVMGQSDDDNDLKAS